MPTPPKTNNHDLPLIPPVGEDDADEFAGEWGEIINDEGWGQLEELLIARDVDDDRTEYEPYDGALFWASDTGAVYVGTGTEWELRDAEFSEIVLSSLVVSGSITADTGTTIWDGDTESVPHTSLDSDTVTVASNEVSLGSEIDIDHGDLSLVSDDDHHVAHEHPGDRAAESDLNMSDESITNVSEISGDYATHSFDGTNYNIDLEDSDADARYRTSTSDTIIWIRETGNVEIPSGRLDVSDDVRIDGSSVAIDGDEQPPESHGNQAHDETYASVDRDIEGFNTSGSAGTVPVSQGDGTVAMEDTSGGGHGYEQDGPTTFNINLEP